MSPIVTIQFALPEEQPEFDSARLGSRAKAALWDIHQHCRSITKHGEPPPGVRELCDEIKAMIPLECLE